MNQPLARRLAAIAGLVVAALVAAWWLGSMRLAIDRGADTGRSSAEVLQVAWLVRAVLVPLLAVRVGALSNWRAGASAALAIVVLSWPVLALAWSASPMPLSQTVFAEALLLVAALVLPIVGQGLRALLPRGDIVEPIATTVGLVLAAAVWLAHDAWPFPAAF